MMKNGTACLPNPCQHEGVCSINGINITCECLPCFTGSMCEQNLTKLVPIYAALSYNLPKLKDPFFFLGQSLVIIILIDNFLTLQTVLFSKKIIITNNGVYLSTLSFNRIIVGISMLILYAHNIKDVIHTVNYILLTTLVTFFHISIWLSSFISIERMLIQMKYFNIHLYDSRRRSLIISILVVLFVFITELIIPGIIFFIEKQKFSDKLEIFIRTIFLVHHLIPFILHLIATIVVLIDLIKHQKQFKINYQISHLIFGQILKHRDFFIQPIIYICFTLPLTIIVITGAYVDDDCTIITNVLIRKIILLCFVFFFFAAIIFVFPVYICPSKIYMEEFRNSSIIGRFYKKIKIKCKNYFSSSTQIKENTRL